MYLQLDDFLTGITGGTTDMEIPGLGTIQVRALEFGEVQAIRTKAGDDEMQLSLHSVLVGMVAPALSEEHLTALHKARPGVIAAISTRILELSGMTDNSEKKVGIGS
jgi:hypothetical protein